ncbi:methyltransferase domain-containing protein [Nocardia takedensis]|uniref:methyltransferase domain-containing protein n=1 Tax=Nocardia takedensis TaxID=259390 RepID=UPI00031D6A43|nr:methyltransferase domain-containing protein [Nocardia takedensis]
MDPAAPADSIGDYLISARSLDEYRAMFALTDTDLHDRAILDCPGGAAAFAAEAAGLGARVTAVDPAYVHPADRLRDHVLAETDRGAEWLDAHADRYVWGHYGTPEHHHRVRRAAATRFAADRTAHPSRYIAAALPALPFPDNDFDLVLSSHLLFTYADRLDTDFHHAALRELLRVARGEVRVYPLVDYLGVPQDALVAELSARLAEHGVRTEHRTVTFEFHRGADTMLILRN